MRAASAFLIAACFCATAARADWRAATPDVERAVREPRVAAALRAADAMDRALLTDDHALFASQLAADFAVNNPQNRISRKEETAKRNAAGQIAYTRYDRRIEFAGTRGEHVVLMGEESVTPKAGPHAGLQVRRRFTDLWREEGGRWVLTLRQATVIEAR